MDAKTFEYMNERCKKYKEIKAKINELNAKVEKLETHGFGNVYFTINGNYYEVPSIDKELMKETLLKLMTDKIEALEKELQEI